MRAGLSLQPQDYRRSSAATHLGLRADSTADPWLDLDFWRKEGGAERWHSLLGLADDYAAICDLQRCTFTGRPYGDSDFIGTWEQRLGRRLQARRWVLRSEAGKALSGP